MGKSEQVVTWLLNLIFQLENAEGSKRSSDICCLYCPTTDLRNIHQKYELMVDGFLVNVGIGIVPLIRSSSIAKRIPVPICTGIDPVAPGVAA